jgi:hypothetical protein
MKVVQFNSTNAVSAISKVLNDNGYNVVNLSSVDSFGYDHFYHMETCDFFVNNGTFGSKHPKRAWVPEVSNSKTAVMNHRNGLVNMFAQQYGKKVIHTESATLSRIKCNYVDKFYKEMLPIFYRVAVGHWVHSQAKWCAPIPGRLEYIISLIENKNDFKFENIFEHRWKNNKQGAVVILPGVEDDPTSSIPVDKFVADTVTTIRKHSKRKIIIKAHPHSLLTYDNLKGDNVEIILGLSKITDLADDLYCAVLDSSTSIFELVELGIPSVTTDHSFGAPLGNTDINKIENLHYASGDEVRKWFERMASTEFTLEELGRSKIILPRIKELLNV